MSRTLNELTDEELIAEFQRENEAAFTLLVGRFKDPLTNFVYRFVSDGDDSNDIVQETFVRVYRSKHSYKPVAKFSTWVYTIATNLSKTHLRRKRLRNIVSFGGRVDGEGEMPLDLPDEGSRTDALVDARIKEERIQKALDSLPAKYREIIVLRDIQDLSYEEIAAITGINIGTVKSRINRGRAQLQVMLRDLWNDR